MLATSPGAACGQAVFTANEAEAAAKIGLKVILVRVETSPEDIPTGFAPTRPVQSVSALAAGDGFPREAHVHTTLT